MPKKTADNSVLFQYDKKERIKAEQALKEHKQILENADLHRRRAMLAARRCLKLKAFQAYRINYMNAKTELINALMKLPFTDAVTYAVHCKDIIDRIRNLSVLLNDVERKSK